MDSAQAESERVGAIERSTVLERLARIRVLGRGAGDSELSKVDPKDIAQELSRTLSTQLDDATGRDRGVKGSRSPLLPLILSPTFISVLTLDIYYALLVLYHTYPSFFPTHSVVEKGL